MVIMSEVFERFLAQSPICVMEQALLENVFAPAKIDAVFHTTAVQQYERQLLFSTLVGVAVGLWVIGSLAIPGWGWAAMGFLALWNVQFLCLAILGEYVVRTHRHTQRRPLYVVESLIENGQALPGRFTRTAT